MRILPQWRLKGNQQEAGNKLSVLLHTYRGPQAGAGDRCYFFEVAAIGNPLAGEAGDHELEGLRMGQTATFDTPDRSIATTNPIYSYYLLRKTHHPQKHSTVILKKPAQRVHIQP